MWLIAEYEATTLFSLKPATATASGGRTLLVPTPFAVKMALLDAACRLEGQAVAAELWEAWLAGLTVALAPPPRVVVNNTFIKVRKRWEFKGKKAEKEAAQEKAKKQRRYPFGSSISYREYAQWEGRLGIALGEVTTEQADWLIPWLAQINYLGKRGSFVQLQAPPALHEALPEGYLAVGEALEMMPVDALLTQLDDVGAKVSFAHVNVYDKKRLRLGKERVLHHVALPYRLVASSRGYSYYALSEETP